MSNHAASFRTLEGRTSATQESVLKSQLMLVQIDKRLDALEEFQRETTRSLLKWIFGIASAVIASVIIAAFTIRA